MEGDSVPVSSKYKRFVFQSTPSAWRETCRQHLLYWYRHHFNPLPPHGGRRLLGAAHMGRCYFNPLPPHGGRHASPALSKPIFVFQSTPSAWRETTLRSRKSVHVGISIHSLRMEGDTHKELLSIGFYKISIHSLRMEGDWRSASS